MKSVLITFFLLFSTIVLGQDINTKELFPELFQMKLPIEIPKIQFVPEKELYMKEKKLTIEKGVGYRVTFKDKSVFVGSIQSNYGGHENTVSISYGEMSFSNGDKYKGNFYGGYPIDGKYIYANGDSLEITSADRNGCCNFTGKSINQLYKFKDGTTLKMHGYEGKTKFYYEKPDGTKIISLLNPDKSLDGYTEYYTKEGFFFKGELSNNRPIKNWEIQNDKGAFIAIFNLDGITGYVPYKDESNTTKWGKFYLGKLVQPITYLAPYTFCVKGDCQNGEATIYVAKNPETGFSYEMVGKFENGKPIGDFVTNDEDINKNKYTIIGPIKNYKFHGKCTKAYLDKKIAFIGEFQNGLPQKGNLTVDDKLVEVKSFKQGKYIGKQIFPRSDQYSSNSRYYEGEFDYYGRIQGSGTVYFETGYKLDASDWNDGKSSNCTFTTPNNYSEIDFYCNIYGGSYYRSLGNQKELDYYAAKRAEEEQARQQEVANQIQSEHQCGQCNGFGVIKVQCPMCKGAGYRKDLITYDKHTGNTGGLAKCSHCAGTGQYTVMGCSKCNGKGYVKN